MIILGIDPGYATTGFGLISADRGQYRLLQYGTITTPADLPFPERLNMLFEDMNRLLEVTKPEAVAVEELLWGHNICHNHIKLYHTSLTHHHHEKQRNAPSIADLFLTVF